MLYYTSTYAEQNENARRFFSRVLSRRALIVIKNGVIITDVVLCAHGTTLYSFMLDHCLGLSRRFISIIRAWHLVHFPGQSDTKATRRASCRAVHSVWSAPQCAILFTRFVSHVSLLLSLSDIPIPAGLRLMF